MFCSRFFLVFFVFVGFFGCLFSFNPEHLDTVLSFVKIGRVSETSFADFDLSNADLINLDLSSADFRGADLRGTNFTGSTLDGSIFRGAILGRDDNGRPTNFRNASLVKADFNGVILYRSDFTDAKLRQASFRNADFHYTNILEVLESYRDGVTCSNIFSYIIKNSFYFRNLFRRNIFRVLKFQLMASEGFFSSGIRPVFYPELPPNTFFVGCCFAEPNTPSFENSMQANFSGAVLEDSNFDNTRLGGSRMINTNFTKVNFDHASFKNAYLPEIVLENANLSRITHSGQLEILWEILRQILVIYFPDELARIILDFLPTNSRSLVDPEEKDEKNHKKDFP